MSQSGICNLGSGIRRRRLRALLTHALLVLGAAILAIPFFWVVMAGLESRGQALGASTFHVSGWPAGGPWPGLDGQGTLAAWFPNWAVAAALVTVAGLAASSAYGLRTVLRHAALGEGAVVVAFPFLWMVMTALKGEREARGAPTLLPSGWPWEWHWGNFARAWGEMEPPFSTCFLNTLIVAVAVTAAVVVTSLLAGYAFARINFVGRRALFVVFLATMMVPFEVVLVPNYMLVTSARRALGLEGTAVGAFAALIVPWCANVFSIFLVTQFFRQMPQDYYDAAVLDGCGHWQFVWRIGMPMVAPALVTAGLFSFLGSWNSLLWPLVVNNPGEADVLQVALTRMVQEEQEGFNLLMAASTFTILPIVFLYLAAQRRFIEGVTGTGLKG